MSRLICSFISKLTRKKHLDVDHMSTNLKRCLTTFDVTLLGIGHMMGSGIYVLTPTVARDTAGPAIIISYLISGLASLLAALAYAEFGVRFPRAGSAYSYSYFSVGEFWAFFVGWNVLLENVIGISAVARACSEYIDGLTGHAIAEYMTDHLGEFGDGVYFSKRPDFLAFIVVIIYIAFMSVGVHATSWLNNILCMTNIVILILIAGVGAYFADFSNWAAVDGKSGFMPYGFDGVLKASATCFYAYVGFDAIAASGEEAKNPQKSLPVATLLSMAIVTITYVTVSGVLTLMVRYSEIPHTSGLPAVLAQKGAVWASYTVTIGALAGMSTVLIATLFALTRIAYAMADDGLIHVIFAKVMKKSQIPLVSMSVFGSLAALMAAILEIETLVEMMSIGTLSAYLIVSGGCIIFRYRPNKIIKTAHAMKPMGASNGHNQYEVDDEYESTGQALRNDFQWMSAMFPSGLSQQGVISTFVATITISSLILGFDIRYAPEITTWWSILIICLSVAAILFSLLVITAHQECTEPQAYRMPWVPLLPALSIIINAILMTTLNALTWGRLAIWMAVGYTSYFVYGIRHSKLN